MLEISKRTIRSQTTRQIAVAVALLAWLGCAAPSAETSDEAAREHSPAPVAQVYGELPLYLVPNQGQLDEKVRFYAQGTGHSMYFTADEVVLALGDEKTAPARVALGFLDSNSEPEIVAVGLQEGRVNYFVGNEPSRWTTGIPTYRSVIYKGLYEGIDLEFYGNQRQLEYDIVVGPGADPSRVRFSYEGIQGLSVSEDGDLEIALEEGKLIQTKPWIYQEIDGRKVAVEGAFRIDQAGGIDEAGGVYGFDLAAYDQTRPLVIDPVLQYSTYFGGATGPETPTGIALDASNNIYIVGSTFSTDFPTASPIQAFAGHWDAFVTKLSADGSTLIYSTYLGGGGTGFSGDGNDFGEGIAVDASGGVYVTGQTQSSTFPTVSPIQAAKASFQADAFVTRIDPTGSSLVFSTYLGGTEFEVAEDIALDCAGNVYVAGRLGSTNFPTVAPLQPASGGGGIDGFVTKMNPAGSALTYSTYLGGNGSDEIWALAVDCAGNAFVTGGTQSTNFPGAAGTLQGGFDGFVAQINVAGTALGYSTYLAGSGNDTGFGITVDGAGDAYVTGSTSSTDFPIAPSGICQVGVTCPFQGVYGGGTRDAFVTVINPGGVTVAYSTYLGGTGADAGRGIAVDAFGRAYVTGDTDSTDFPTVLPIQASNGGGFDTFVTLLNPVGAALDYSTYLGGNGAFEGPSDIALNAVGDAYVAGVTESTDFPTVEPFQANYAGQTDGFVARIGEPPPSNDFCVDASVVNGGFVPPTLDRATNDGTATCGNSSDQPDIWYEFTAPADGVLRVDTCGTSDTGGIDAGTDTVLSLHTLGCPGNVASEITCNDDWTSSADPTACAGLDDGDGRDSFVSHAMLQGDTVLIRGSRFASGVGAVNYSLGVNFESADSDGDGIPDGADNCQLVANPGQEDANSSEDDDTSIPGVQHYGNACDADLDEDGVVTPSDFFNGFRPCIGSSAPQCAEADFNSDGIVAASDFFSLFRPSIGGPPGPGFTEP